MMIDYWNIVICNVDPTSNLGLIYLIHWELQAQICAEITQFKYRGNTIITSRENDARSCKPSRKHVVYGYYICTAIFLEVQLIGLKTRPFEATFCVVIWCNRIDRSNEHLPQEHRTKLIKRITKLTMSRFISTRRKRVCCCFKYHRR